MQVLTGGAVIFTQSKSYQIILRHVFSKSGRPPAFGWQPSFQEDFDMEPSDDEVDFEHEIEDESSTEWGTASFDDECVPRDLEFSHMSGGTHIASRLTHATFTTNEERSIGMSREDGQGMVSSLPSGSVCIGGAIYETQTGLDYALLEIDVDDDDDPNLISYNPCTDKDPVRVTRHAGISKMKRGLTVPVLVISSSGSVRGKLSTTAAYVSASNYEDSTAVYPVTIDKDETLEPSDRGAAVINTEGHLFGHILFGIPGSQLTYIVPMELVAIDVAAALKLDPRMNFYARPKTTLKVAARTERQKKTEFASQRFYEDVTEQEMPKRHRFRSLYCTIRDSAVKAKFFTRKPSKEQKEMNKPFDRFFFTSPLSSPPEIRDIIIRWLDFRSAMNLRQVSRQWRAAVSVNGSAISKRFLVRNPLPPLAGVLYPHHCPDMLHIQKVGHCHAVASRVADHMASWLQKEIFLHGTRFQGDIFQATKLKIKRRLVPSLFLLVHFFQHYPRTMGAAALQQKIRYTKERGFLFERMTMEHYDSRLILQTLDVMTVFVPYLKRCMRPPSKYGTVEKALYRYYKEPASDKELSAMLCIGGLNRVAKLVDMKDYDKRVTAVREYYQSLLRGCAESRPSTAFSGSTKEKSPHTAVEHDTGIQEMLVSSTPCDIDSTPPLESIWGHTARALLEERKVLWKANSYEQALKELILKENTLGDVLYREGHDLWHALEDREVQHGHIAPEA
ncbi:hypothetical protein GQ53DRAFT_826915 [Thozetella sp. PMI_491]|nr:hypothetical protein GQ53DRAFT_826915 [Thozetella sp. PMI_491]